MSVPILSKQTRWYCPNCERTAVTSESKPHSQMHHCAGLRGVIAPLVEVGTKAKIEVREREDYIGKEHVRLQAGRPVMSVVTTRDDGQDAMVFAPVATARAKE